MPEKVVARLDHDAPSARASFNDRMSRASTQEEIEQLSREVDGLVSNHQKLVDDVTAEVVRLEKQGRKGMSLT